MYSFCGHPRGVGIPSRRGWCHGRVRCSAFNFRRSGSPEHSERAHREVVLFLAQRELESAFQRLVNMEMYEEARQVASQQEKLQELASEELEGGGEEAGLGGIASLFKRKQDKGAGEAEVSQDDRKPKLDDGEVVVKLLSLRTDLQRAIDGEDYARASAVRDEILEIENEVERQKKASKDLAQREPKYSLGQCVVHWQDGWTGVVCGMQQEKRKKSVKNPDEGSVREVEELVYSYHVLPSSQYWKKRSSEGVCVALVDESELNAPQPPATWRSVHGSDPENFLIYHPYMYLLFYGQDGEGNYVPSKKLRDKYKKQRKDVYWNGGSSSEGEDA
ncbi:hypothetical protein HOP50_20g85290 [Chloropicon primus]|uniref:UVR domain-containing protein n=1 Tax=Chloropicon primus TaxID=1764295 RepID=A0A5B8MZQ6_9CHLO|nr:hypothetical protein A3770_20p84970 [Chloropicon primus]UPR05179.1 hypothetical protein HOP50_20g85290 [Chloropicon primus]|mmetsp:Transcript_3028/g.8201  ORF Transcript_3028/g.8201 Transcript_3028/m.8201 type:complete len:332 (+) Transcript_3028:406-1401(+)|eukprot:QDZ25979.1 hypothetical protein A3770_20p84970 [Chloropicon primus]